MKPEAISENKELSKLFDVTVGKCKETYDLLRKMGVDCEDARFVLPIATQTKIAMTMNARELRHFFAMRCCLRAQWEIRELANRILKICKATAPSLFEDAGPSCVRLGYCPEAELTCGKLTEILRIYKRMRKDHT